LKPEVADGSGMVRSKGVALLPGQALEVRVKLTPANPADQGGLWPAVWASGIGPGSWPASGEVDFLEVMTATDPRRSIYSIHYAKSDGSPGVTNKPVVGSEPFSAQWHTVRFDYGVGGRLVWSLDGQVVESVSSAPTGQGFPAPFDQPIKEIKVNLALGGRPGPLAPGALGSGGATFEVDYLRITTL
jgi:beta-glucanase (GH16 family)